MRRVDLIKYKVCIFFEINSVHMVSTSRQRRYAWPRQIAMYLCRKHTNMSFSDIGHEFLKDHTTVLHACRRTQGLIDANNEFRDSVAEIERMLPWIDQK